MRALAILLLAASAFAEPFRFEPLPPSSTSFLHLQVATTWRDGCVPRNARVTRDGQSIEVLWSVPKNGGCPAAISSWEDRVAIGVLEPGVYEVVLKVDDHPGVDTIATRKLAVSDGAPAFHITPTFASTRGGSEVVLTPLTFTDCDIPTAAPVIVDGVTVTGFHDGCSIRVSLPPHDAGPVDVSLRDEGTTYTVKATLHYVDPAAAPDETLFARILIPVLYSGPGAFGSQWVTEGELHNRSFETLQWFSNVAKPCATCPATLGMLRTMALAVLGNRSNGVILFVPRTLADDVHLGAIARDVTRDGSWGAEVPIARERDFRDELLLPNILIDPRYRTTLRIYGIDGIATIAGIDVRKDGVSITSKIVKLVAPCTATPCNSADPAHATVDVGSVVPAGTKGSVMVAIYRASAEPLRAWGFVSITNNETQHVTVIRPQ